MTTVVTTNVQTVRDMYAAFNRGDIPFILQQLSPTVRWTAHLDPIVPWAGEFSGARTPKFFQAIANNVEVLGFEPQEYIGDGDNVVATGTFACKANSTGKSTNVKWVMLWKFKNGQVESYEQFQEPAIADIFKA